ncbi:hypothetical protein H9638_03840 [Arthrobacter sp. Sa2BUA2]|uniref:DUF5642 domain-containing protein n=1 Tax=Arthrobacter pullicola TaxID=2762224 RepID=A0ABR8YFH0_9MICC|nr:hypothetical protein [Arthrobacter pullicola]MBD8042940.1 hypothetical protein [Arthrobacter pullicola]
MKKSMKTGALLVAGVFALSGCGSSSEAADSGSAESSSSPTPTLAVGQDQYTADELEAALTAAQKAMGFSGIVDNDASVRSMLEAAGFLSVTATPAQCATLGSSLFDETITTGNSAAMEMEGTDALLLVSYKDASVPDERAEIGEQLASDCAEFELENKGMTISGAAEALEVSTEAPSTQAFRTTITQPGGKAEIVQVQAHSGTVSLSVSMFDPADAAAAVDVAEKTINAALAELAKM